MILTNEANSSSLLVLPCLQGKQPIPPQLNFESAIKFGNELLTKGLKQMFEAIIYVEDVEECVVKVELSIDFKIFYNGAK